MRQTRLLQGEYIVSQEDIVNRVHGTNKLTARERIDLLLDQDSAVEYGAIYKSQNFSRHAPIIMDYDLELSV